MKKTILATAVLMAFANIASATATDYSNQTLDTAIHVIGDGNSISGDNVKVVGSELVTVPDRNEGIYVGKGSSAHFGGEYLEVKFHTDDTAHEFAGIQVNGQAESQGPAPGGV